MATHRLDHLAYQNIFVNLFALPVPYNYRPSCLHKTMNLISSHPTSFNSINLPNTVMYTHDLYSVVLLTPFSNLLLGIAIKCVGVVYIIIAWVYCVGVSTARICFTKDARKKF